MMVCGAWPSQLDDIVSFRRSKQGFRYLGITLTPQVTQLYQANYKKKYLSHSKMNWQDGMCYRYPFWVEWRLLK